MSLPTRISDRIAIEPAGCWLWTASRDNHGYGQLRHEGRTRKAYRVVYELLVGPVPAGLELDHLCRVRHCVNPDHLEPVTHAENLRRGDGGRMWAERTHCPQGHAYDALNTKVYRGRRYCRRCKVADQRRRRAEGRAVAA